MDGLSSVKRGANGELDGGMQLTLAGYDMTGMDDNGRRGVETP